MPTVALNLVLNEGRVFSGDVLNATVLLDSGDPDTVIHEFVAEVDGTGRTGWINVHTDKIYETEQEYLSAFLPLCPTNQSGMALKPGRHQFSVRVLIPDNAPSSYESQFGSIRYTIKICLLTNAESSSATEVFPFIVVARTSFDEIPQAIMQPIDYRDETDFTVCTLPFGTIYVVISLERTCFCIGEQIPDCRLQFLLKTQFEAKSRYEHAHDRKLVEQVMDSWPLGKVKGRTEARFKDCALKVADGVVPTHQASGTATEPNIIHISYVLRFNAEPGVETEIPLVITSEGYRKRAADYNRPRGLEGKERKALNYTTADDSLETCGHSTASAKPAAKRVNDRQKQKRVSIFEGDMRHLHRYS